MHAAFSAKLRFDRPHTEAQHTRAKYFDSQKAILRLFPTRRRPPPPPRTERSPRTTDRIALLDDYCRATPGFAAMHRARAEHGFEAFS